MYFKNKFFVNKFSWLDNLENCLFEHSRILFVSSYGALQREAVKKIHLHFSKQIKSCIHDVPNLPDIEYYQEKINYFKYNKDFDVILAIGGGSVLDASKVFKFIINKSEIKNAYEISSIKDFKINQIPSIIAIPTTAGSGSEVTQFATLWDKKNKIKQSISHPGLLPDYYILDSNLLESLNYSNLIFPALDSISHALDSIWNVNMNEESKDLALKSLNYSAIAFKNNFQFPNKDIYTNLILASNTSGKAINITKTSLSHSISYPLTIHFGVPHGLAVSFTLNSIFNKFQNKLELNKKNTYLITSILTHFESINLKSLINNYLDKDIAFSLIPEMYNPQRFSNFRFSINSDDIFEILSQSFT